MIIKQVKTSIRANILKIYKSLVIKDAIEIIIAKINFVKAVNLYIIINLVCVNERKFP